MKWKSILKITILFILGMIVGAIIMSRVVHSKMRHMIHSKDGDGFSKHILSHMDLSKEETSDFKIILDKYGMDLKSIHENFKNARISKLDALSQEASIILSKENMEHLNKHLSRMKKPHRRHRKK